MTERIAWFQCAAGTAGDMTLGALVAAGADPNEVAFILQGLGVDGWALTFEGTQRGGIAATHAVVITHGSHEGPAHDHTHHGEPADEPPPGRTNEGATSDRDHDHSHQHGHDHAQGRERGHEDGGHEHGHDHARKHDREHQHSHEHDPDREHRHGAEHGHDADHAHDRDRDREHQHDHGHEHNDEREHPYSHEHDHRDGGHDEPADERGPERADPEARSGQAHAHGGGHGHRPYREIRDLIERAELPARVRERSLRVFAALAEVEGAMHGIDPDDVEFHEVGSLDAIVDVVGTCAALESLGVDRIECSPITVGQGTVRAAHGILPNPAPAVVELLARVHAPVRGIDERREIATPTGVALMTALAERFGPMPAMTVTAAGFGAGTSDIPGRPNVVQAVIGERSPATVTPEPGTASRLIEANVDDATGEVLAHTIAALIAAGAQDAWITPIVMKKGRPAHTVHVLADPAHAAAIAAVLVAETGTLGLRSTTLDRWPQARADEVVDVDGQSVRIKRTAGRVKVEYDDAARAAEALGLPLRTVLHRAEAAAG